MENQRLYTQVLIIGSGIAGCSAALVLADGGHDVTLINAGEDLNGGNSELAQGGIIYEAAGGQDAQALEKDILVAGHHYNHLKAVRHLCHFGPAVINQLLLDRVKIAFDRQADGTWDLTREGGHGKKRILHKADYTGRAIMEALNAAVRAHAHIRVLHNRTAIDLLTTRHHARQSDYRYSIQNRCLGAYVFNEQAQETQTILADWTILATGGVGQIFLHSTNSPHCIGSGISMAQRAGAALGNLEFMQFHPTALYHRLSHRRPLITEALRGEGAILLDVDGKPFMQRYDERRDLAPRDIVAQAMLTEMLHSGAPCLFLDARHIEADLETRFPTVFQTCREIGVDMRKEPIPVVPAAHYFCGGVLSDLHGRTSLEGLYAVGECACNGLHGANRLASTSLLEGLVWGWSAAHDLLRRTARSRDVLSQRLRNAVPDWHHVGHDTNDDPALIAQDWGSIRNIMWNYVGISRNTARLRRAFEELRDLSRHIHDFYKSTRISRQLVDLFHGVHTAYYITQAALRNTHSLGCHQRIDAPHTLPDQYERNNAD